MAQGTYTPDPFIQFEDANGNPLQAGQVFTYIAGTSTPQATYSDINVSVANANPIVLGSDGRNPAGAIFLVPGQSYKFVLKDVNNNTIATRDNISAVPAPSTSTNIDILGTAGQGISAGQPVYLSAGDGGKTAGQWYVADSTNNYSSTLRWMGIAPNVISIGAVGTIRLGGYITGLAGLTVGDLYYVGIAGALTTSQPGNGNIRLVGQADTTTSLVMSIDPPLATVPLTVPLGGTGLAASPGNGQLLIGNGANYTQAAITPLNGINVTNGVGSISISAVTIAKAIAELDVTNTTVETALCSFSIAGGTLSTANALRLLVVGLMHTDTNTDTLTLRWKYGGTVIASWSESLTATTDGGFESVCILSANGATNSQRAEVKVAAVAAGTNSGSGTVTPAGQVGSGYNNVLAVDSTTAQTFTLTAQWSGTFTTDHCKRFLATVEILQ